MRSGDVLCKANAILATFNNRTEFVRAANGRLCLKATRVVVGHLAATVGARVGAHRGALCVNYGEFGMGGTQAMAVGQLVLWIRGKPRVPLRVWEYWAGPKMLLAGGHGPELLRLLRESSYDDGIKTRCVLCGGNMAGLDWWNGDVTGPCCQYGECQRKAMKA